MHYFQPKHALTHSYTLFTLYSIPALGFHSLPFSVNIPTGSYIIPLNKLTSLSAHHIICTAQAEIHIPCLKKNQGAAISSWAHLISLDQK